MTYHVTVGDRSFEVTLDAEDTTVDGERVEFDLADGGESGARSVVLDGASFSFRARRLGRGRWEVLQGGRAVLVGVQDDRERAIAALAGDPEERPAGAELRAPMPGLVVRVEVAVGDQVDEGAGLVIVEAMKMENELTAAGPGTVRSIHIAEGDTVERDQLLVELEPPGEDA